MEASAVRRSGRVAGGSQSHGAFERMSALDAVFLAAEGEHTPMHLGSLSILDAGPLVDERGAFRLHAVRTRVAERLHLVPRFRQRVREVPFGQGRPVWVDDEQFRVEDHVRLHTLEHPGTREQLVEACCELQMQLLDRRRPLWEIWFVEGLEDGSIAMVQKLHHAMVDGVSGVDVAAALFDVEPAPSRIDVPDWHPVPSPSPSELLVRAELERVRQPAIWWRAVREVVRTPVALTRVIGGMADAVAGELGMLAGGRTFTADVGSQRRLDWVEVPLEGVRTVAHRHRATVNDVVLATIAEATSALREHRGLHGAGPTMEILVPVSTRAEDQHGHLGNRVSAMLVPVPIGGPSIEWRIDAVRDAMSVHKGHHQADGIEVALDSLELLPSSVASLVARTIHRQPLVDVVVTNVAGPPFPLYFMGARITASVPIVPLGGNLAVGIALLSYDGRLTVGVHSDPEACPDVEVLVDGLRRAFDEVADLV